MYKASVTITLRPSILDPQGKAMQHALHDLGQTSIAQVRAGKFIELVIDASSAEAAEGIAHTACEKLLANAVMEDFSIDVVQLDTATA